MAVETKKKKRELDGREHYKKSDEEKKRNWREGKKI